jgi:hypothetical protein
MQKSFATVFVVLFSSFFLFAQETLVPSGMNPFLINNESPYSNKAKAVDLKLPFLEDFSSTFVYPDFSVFIDSTTYINSSFAISPISIGVATFDGLDAHGYLYEHGSSFAFPADSLTSLALRLDSIFSGTPHPSVPADSIYFSFFYQPQGYGEKPDGEDSLLLEFYAANQDKWVEVWSVGGTSYSSFLALNGYPWKCVMIAITDTAFLNDGFRFRFRNYASYADLSFPSWAGNADFWNIDYIFIDSDRDFTDTIPSDLAFREKKETLLKNHYSMPWNQFMANVAGEMADEINIPYTNYSSSLLNVTERLIITDLSGTTTTYNSGLSAANLTPQTDTSFYRSPIPYTFTTLLSENAEFLIQMAINTATISDPIKKNDTLAFYQHFYNYFASDDGSAEAGYGLTINGGKASFRFDLNTPDTLRSVLMFFNRTVNDANQIYFYLTIWDDNGGVPGNIIYQQLGVRPEFEDGFYNFHNYTLETPLAVSGSIYVGWIQTTDEVLNLGFDKNNDRSLRLFYNTDGTWYNSLYAGTPMIRIVVGNDSEPHVGIDETENTTTIYPNPCSNCGFVSFSDSELKKVTIIDMNGKMVQQVLCEKEFNTENLSAGFYTIVVEKKSMVPVMLKLVITE